MSHTFVLVHGTWHGGWCWRLVADRLRANGHLALTPTLTGLGQSRHLLSSSVTLDVHITDIANLIETEELEGVVLVGHSYAGAIVLGVADRMPRRLRQLVLLDALVLRDGESPLDTLAPDEAAARRRLVVEQGQGVALPAPKTAAIGLPEEHPRAAWVRRRLTPHPAATYESQLALRHPLGNSLPCAYVECVAPTYAPIARSHRIAREQSGWRHERLETGHEAMITAPDALSTLLTEIAASGDAAR